MAQDNTPDTSLATRAEVEKITRNAIERELNFAKNAVIARDRLYKLLIIIIIALFAALFGVVFLHQQGIVEFSLIQRAETEAGAPNPIDAQSLLSILLPVFAVVGAFIVGITGLQRLQAYDEEFRNNRAERRTDMRDLEARVKQQLDEGQRVAQREAAAAAERVAIQSAEKSFEISFGNTNKRQEEIEKAIDVLNERIDKRIERIRPLLEKPEVEKLLTGQNVASMGQLHELLSKLLKGGEDKDINSATILVNKALADGVVGTADDTFNAATTLAQADLEPLAYKVANAGLTQFPNNLDLLSNTLKFASDAGFVDEAKEIFGRIKELPLDQRNWRIWVFGGDYLYDRGLPGEAEAWYQNYTSRYFNEDWTPVPEADLPSDVFNERVAASYVTLLNRYGRFHEGTMITEAVTSHYPRSPQTSLGGASIMRELGEYEKAAAFAKNALVSDVLDQSNTGNAAAYELRGTWSLMQVINAIDAHEIEKACEAAEELFLFCNAMISSPDLRPNHLEWIRYNGNKAAVALMKAGMTPDGVRDMVPERIRPLVASIGTSGGASASGEAEEFGGIIDQVWSAIKDIAASDKDEWPPAIGGLVVALRNAVPDEALPAIVAQLQAKAEAEGTDDEKDVVRQISERLQN